MDINLGQIIISFLVLVFSLTVHESAHAWTADRLGDPTARALGRISLNPLVHADPIGTLLFPLIGLLTHAPIIGWAKPVPVSTWRFSNPRRDYLLVAAAGPVSNLSLALVAAVALRLLPAAAPVAGARPPLRTDSGCRLRRARGQSPPGDLQHAADPAARRRDGAGRPSARAVSLPASIAFARTGSCCSTR